jgi:hypothetical protein
MLTTPPAATFTPPSVRACRAGGDFAGARVVARSPVGAIRTITFAPSGTGVQLSVDDIYLSQDGGATYRQHWGIRSPDATLRAYDAALAVHATVRFVVERRTSALTLLAIFKDSEGSTCSQRLRVPFRATG